MNIRTLKQKRQGLPSLEAGLLWAASGIAGIVGGGILAYSLGGYPELLEAERARVEHFKSKHEVMLGSGHTTEPYVIIEGVHYRLEDSTYNPSCTEDGNRCPYDNRFPPRIKGNR